MSVVVEDEEAAMRIAVDETRLYWLSILQNGARARIRGCQKADCRSTIVTYEELPLQIPTPYGSSEPESYFLAAAANHVYWTRPAIVGVTILGCPSAGCDGAPKVVDDKIDLSTIRVDETHLYWTSRHDTAIYRQPLTGTGPTEAVALNQGDFSDVQVDATHAYWVGTTLGTDGAGGGGGAGAAVSSAIRRVPKQGGERPEDLVTKISAGALALDSRSFVWGTSWPSGSIVRCPLSGCSDAPTVLIGNQDPPVTIVSDGISIFWISLATGSDDGSRGMVMRCPIDDCASRKEALASLVFYFDTRSEVVAMVADDSDVYWIAQGSDPSGGRFYPHATIYRHHK